MSLFRFEGRLPWLLSLLLLAACADEAVKNDGGDTGTADTGTADTGTVDTGTVDTGSTDTGSTDTGSTDTGTADTTVDDTTDTTVDDTTDTTVDDTTDTTVDETTDTTVDDTTDTTEDDTTDTTVDDTTVDDTTLPPITNLCLNDADILALQLGNDTSQAIFEGCRTTCGGATDARQCIADCIAPALGISGLCAGCFGGLAVCDAAACAELCAPLGDLAACNTCKREACIPDFSLCSGFVIDTCGDGIVGASEGCDDGNATNGDGCSESCTVEPLIICGDGVVAASEGCDDGNTTNGDGCSESCTVEPLIICGDGIIAGSEGCDDGNTTGGDGCSATCTVEPLIICGDGIAAGSEGCDDGNTTGGDGCSATCGTEIGYACVGAPSVCETTCGDGIVAGAEVCDGDSPDCSPLCACNIGFHLEGGVCTSDFLDCEVLFGTGVQTWDGSGYGLCLTVACDTSYHLDGDACVSDIRSCSIPNGTGQQRWDGASFGGCQIAACDVGFGDCDAFGANGCETNTASSVNNCGVCGGVCAAAPNAIEMSCNASSCQIAACDRGFSDCNGTAADGCETNTANDVNNCGVCGGVCAAPNAIEMSCNAGSCEPALCLGDFHIEGGSCLSDTRACTMEPGLDEGVLTASQRWSTGSSYGACNAQTCATGYSLGFISSFPSFELRTICQAN